MDSNFVLAATIHTHTHTALCNWDVCVLYGCSNCLGRDDFFSSTAKKVGLYVIFFAAHQKFEKTREPVLIIRIIYNPDNIYYIRLSDSHPVY